MKFKKPIFIIVTFVISIAMIFGYFKYQKYQERQKWLAFVKKWNEKERYCGYQPWIDVAGHQDYYLDQARLELFYRALDNVTPMKKENGKFTHSFAPSWRALYLSNLKTNDYKQFVQMIEKMDIYKTLEQNFRIDAGVINHGGKIRYFIYEKDVNREDFINFFLENRYKYTLIHDNGETYLNFIPLQKEMITFEEKQNRDADPYKPYKYIAHYYSFPFHRYCCDIEATTRFADYEKTPRLYTSKDIIHIEDYPKIDINMLIKTRDIELISRIGKFDTKRDIEGGKSTPVKSLGIIGYFYSLPISLCTKY